MGGNVLLRRYLCKRLSEYYSQPADKVIGSIDSTFVTRVPSSSRRPRDDGGGAIKQRSVDFSSLINEWHWKRTYERLYKDQGGIWLTPVELFYPYYSNVMANFVTSSVSTLRNNNATRYNEGFDVVELGGGRGTNAVAFLDHMCERHPEAYERLRHYTIFDTSPTLHALQREVLYGSNHRDKVKFVNVDMLDVAEGNTPFLSPSDAPTAVIALELLDNLPHDKIGRCMATGDVLQAEVVPVSASMTDFDTTSDGAEVDDPDAARPLDTSIQYVEAFARMNDPLLTKVLSIDPSIYAPTIGPHWVPTVALGMLLKLLECRPNSIVALADFDWLPPPDLRAFSSGARQRGGTEPAVGDPLVTDMDGNDHSCYLTEPPSLRCDILFPTDFARMSNFVTRYLEGDMSERSSKGEDDDGYSATAMKQRDFLLRYGLDEVNKTKGYFGYSPLISDFGNCSVLTITPFDRK